MAGAGEIVHLYIEPSMQGLGVGKALLQRSKEFLGASGHLAVKLSVVAGNDRAVRFYEREGGRVVGKFVDGVLWRSENLIIQFPLVARANNFE